MARIACAALSTLHHLGQSSERYLHLAYFAGISTGVLNYHHAALGCLVAGLLLFLPAMEGA